MGRSDFWYGVNNCAVAFECGRTGRAKRHDFDGHGFAVQAKIGPRGALLCGLERPWLAGQGELGVAASSRVPETVELATSERRARPPAALGLARLPVSGAGSSPMLPPRANAA